jgi:DNA transposition AAA+ family ATPase
MRFIETDTYREVKDAVEFGLRTREPIIITGPSSVGKTTALVAIVERDPRAALVTLMPSAKSMRALLRATCEAFGFHTDRGYREDLYDILRHQLPGAAERGRFLIVDEVQLLGLLEVFELVKFSEIYGLPVVLCGNEHALKRTNANAAAFDQIEMRKGKWLRLKGVSEADLIAFCVDHNVEGREAYDLIVRFGRRSLLRNVVRVLREARQFAGEKGPIRAANIADAMAYLYGPETVRAIGKNGAAVAGGATAPADVIPIGKPRS